jgi:hypothetical protein
MCLVCFTVVLLGRDTGLPHLLAPNLLMGGKGADLVIRGNVILNKYNVTREQITGLNRVQKPITAAHRHSKQATNSVVKCQLFPSSKPHTRTKLRSHASNSMHSRNPSLTHTQKEEDTEIYFKGVSKNLE